MEDVLVLPLSSTLYEDVIAEGGEGCKSVLSFLVQPGLERDCLSLDTDSDSAGSGDARLSTGAIDRCKSVKPSHLSFCSRALM